MVVGNTVEMQTSKYSWILRWTELRWKFRTYFVRSQAANDKHPLELPQLVLPLCRKILMLGILRTEVFQHSLKHLWITY